MEYQSKTNLFIHALLDEPNGSVHRTTSLVRYAFLGSVINLLRDSKQTLLLSCTLCLPTLHFDLKYLNTDHKTTSMTISDTTALNTFQAPWNSPLMWQMLRCCPKAKHAPITEISTARPPKHLEKRWKWVAEMESQGKMNPALSLYTYPLKQSPFQLRPLPATTTHLKDLSQWRRRKVPQSRPILWLHTLWQM